MTSSCRSSARRPGGLDFSNYFIQLTNKTTTAATNLADAKNKGAVLAYGSFLTIALNFLIIAWVLFMVVRGINKLQRKEAEKPAAPPAPTKEEVLLTEIRDILAKKA